MKMEAKANLVHAKIKNKEQFTSFDFAEAIANTALPKKVCCGKI